VFDQGFRQTLGEILRGAPKLRRNPQTEGRSHRRIRSASGTFSGHRPYTAGEDLRNLDWNVYARTDELFLKVLEDEDRVGLTLLLDRSPSMTADDRWVGARRLAAILGGLALVHFDSLHLVWSSGQDAVLQGAAALNRYLDLLDGLPTGLDQPTGLARDLLERFGAGRVYWLSDFADPNSFAPALAMLRKHGCRCTGWLPCLPTDSVPTADGLLRFADPETGKQELLEVDAALRGAMAQELALLAKAQDALFSTLGYPLVRFALPARGDNRVASWTARGRVYDAWRG
jgi:uncharacterized protein (DUF58 family)